MTLQAKDLRIGNLVIEDTTIYDYGTTKKIREITVDDFSKDWLIVLVERDLADSLNSVIGIANNRENAVKIIQEYYGEDATISELRIIEESGLDFDVKVEVKDEVWGGIYIVTGMDFKINEL